jgi:cytochrome b561
MNDPQPGMIKHRGTGPVGRYPLMLRLLHWSLALLFGMQFALILVLNQLESLEFGQLVLGLHRQCGTLVLLLILARMIVAARLRAPRLDAPRWQAVAARSVHLAMFGALAVQPLIGLLVAWGRGDEVVLFGLIRLPGWGPMRWPASSPFISARSSSTRSCGRRM